jgi:hypothetical protein
MSLEDLEKELYERREKLKRQKNRASTTKKPIDNTSSIQEDWESSETNITAPKKFLSPSKIITLIIVGSLIVTFGAIAFITFSDREPRNIRLEILSPSEVSRGEPFEVNIEITNNLDSLVTRANLSLSVPSGFVYLSGFNGESAIINESLGDMGSGSFTKKTFRFLAVDPANSLKKINVSLSYSTGGRARYEIRSSKEILIKSSAITLKVEKPEKIPPSSLFEFNLVYKNESQTDFPEVAIELRYPNAFKYRSASLTPNNLNNYWRLGELKAGSVGDLQVRGFFENTGEKSFSIPVTIYVSFLGKDYVVLEDLVTVSLASSPISLEILVNRRTDYVARLGDTLNYTLHFENKSNIALADVVIKATLVGELFDFSSLGARANIDSLNNTVTWTAANLPQLKLLEPGASGEVSMSVKVMNSVPIKRLSDKNYVLKVQAQIDSPSVPYYSLEETKTSAVASIETKVAGFVVLNAKVFYRDAASGIANRGSLPPRVNQPVEYTVHWIIKNYSTDIRNVRVSANLQSGVTVTGVMKSNVDTVPLYNERSQEVVWEIPKIPATKGVISDPIEAIFQIRATPNITQVNQFQPLLGESVLRAIDDFTGLELLSRDAALTTALFDDPTVGKDEGRVVQ